ncbi:MAG: hypothetical protein ACK5O8_06655 [Pirellula sp.]
MKSFPTEWILVVAMLAIGASSGCRNTLPNDRPSRLWGVAASQQPFTSQQTGNCTPSTIHR